MNHMIKRESKRENLEYLTFMIPKTYSISVWGIDVMYGMVYCIMFGAYIVSNYVCSKPLAIKLPVACELRC